MPDVNYQFYADTWGGALPETTFRQYLIRAWLVLDCITHGRIGKAWKAFSDSQKQAVMMALCALVDDLYFDSQNNGKEVNLEIVGQHHVGYFQMSITRQAHLRNLVKQFICRINYRGIPLLYRGIDDGCCSCC